MLTTLRVSGFAIVDAIDVRFGPGLNVLTGETGAGKSILVNALHLVLGGRMSGEVLRDGAEEAVVEAIFELPAAHPVLARLEAAGLPIGERRSSRMRLDRPPRGPPEMSAASPRVRISSERGARGGASSAGRRSRGPPGGPQR
jgi:DNA repair ATPase RecN